MSSIKRSRSPSIEDEPNKKGRSDGLLSNVTDQILDEYIPIDNPSGDPPIDHDGLSVYNLARISIDTYGNISPAELPEETVIENGLPTPVTDAPKDTNPFDTITGAPVNFAYTGDVRLFRVIPAKLTVYQYYHATLFPYHEVITLSTNELTLGKLLPQLQDSGLDAIALRNTRLGYAKATYDLRRPSGVYFDTDIVFQGPLQPVSDFLKDFFKQESPSIRFQAYLGRYDSWSTLNLPNQLVFRGSLERISWNVLDVLKFTTLGIELSVRERRSRTGKLEWAFGYGFFGSLDLTVPGAAKALKVDYRLSHFADSWTLSLETAQEWPDCFGVKGLVLSELSFSVTLTSAKQTSISFDMSAALKLNKTTFAISGMYSKDEYCLIAKVGDFTLRDIRNVFKELFDLDLDLFDHDVRFKSLSFVVSNFGIKLHGEVSINGYTSASGTVSISREGVGISGHIGNAKFGEVEIEKAGFDVFIACGKKSKPTRFGIIGTVKYKHITVSVLVELEKPATGPLEWLICGALEGNVSTTTLVPELKGTFLDVSLNAMALIVTNKEKPRASIGGFEYPITKGFQFCAKIGKIDKLSELLNGKADGMVFRAALNYSSKTLAIGLILPDEKAIEFSKDHVYTGRIAMEVLLSSSNIALKLSGVLFIKVETQEDPLELVLAIAIGLKDVKASATMEKSWKNPCGLGKDIAISGCALQIGIDFATFAATGPSSMGLTGTIAIGKKSLGVAMLVSQSPKEQVFAIKINDLGAQDLASFVSLISGKHISDPGDILHVKTGMLYFSTGAYIGEIYHEAGMKANGEVTLFGKQASFKFSISKEDGLHLDGSIENFQVGSLIVSGAKQDRASVVLDLSAAKTALQIDGKVQIWDLEAKVHLDACLHPNPMLDFYLDFKLSDLLVVKLKADGKGSLKLTSLRSLAGMEFSVYAFAEQKVVDETMRLLKAQLGSTIQGLELTLELLDKLHVQSEAAFEKERQKRKDELEARRRAFRKTTSDTATEFGQAKSKIESLFESFLSKLDDNAALSVFAGPLKDKTRDVYNVIRGDETAFEKSLQTQKQLAIRAREEADGAENLLRAKYGDPREALERATQERETHQARVNRVKSHLDSLDLRLISCRSEDELITLSKQKAAALSELESVQSALAENQSLITRMKNTLASNDYRKAESRVQELVMEVFSAKRRYVEALNNNSEALVKKRETALNLFDSVFGGFLRYHPGVAACRLLIQKLLVDPLNDYFNVSDVLRGKVYGAMAFLEFIEFDIAETAIDFWKTQTSETNFNRHALDASKTAAGYSLKAARWAAENPDLQCNIRKIEFTGSLQSLSKGGPPLIVKMEGLISGKSVIFDITWEPNFTFATFGAKCFDVVWEKVKEEAKTIFK